MILLSEYAKLLTEKFEIPEVYKEISDILSNYIAGVGLYNYLKKKIKYVKIKSDSTIVNQNILLNKAKKYIFIGKKYFSVRKTFEHINGIIYLFTYKFKKKLKFPICEVKFEKYKDGDRIVGGSYITESMMIKLNFPISELYTNNKYVEMEVKSVLEHELRHFLQYGMSQNFVTGVPKKQINHSSINLSRFDSESIEKMKQMYPRQFKNLSFHGINVPHERKPIEFKPNVHTYTEIIEMFLNQNIKKSNWKKFFMTWFVNHPDYIDIYEYNWRYEVKQVRKILLDLKKTDRPRWKQYIIEIYKLIFNN